MVLIVHTHWIRFECYCYSWNPLVATFHTSQTSYPFFRLFVCSFVLFFSLKRIKQRRIKNVERKSTLCLFSQEYDLTLCIFELSIFTTTIIIALFVYCFGISCFAAVGGFRSLQLWLLLATHIDQTNSFVALTKISLLLQLIE